MINIPVNIPYPKYVQVHVRTLVVGYGEQDLREAQGPRHSAIMYKSETAFL